jgi:hypothetical protein
VKVPALGLNHPSDFARIFFRPKSRCAAAVVRPTPEHPAVVKQKGQTVAPS